MDYVIIYFMKNKKILVGLSGGVDSAVAAYLLKKEGYNVTCAFMRNWDSFANNDINGNPTIYNDVCPQEEDYKDAKRVAEKLGLELLRVDFVNEYWDYVFTYFLEEYKKGRTPNPDILCNKYIKFDFFLKYAEELGFDYVATGHYAQVQHNSDESILLRGSDSNKDQTYFLCQISQGSLQKALFPIGDIEKPEVRRIAKELQLDIAEKKDSTGICFIGERNFREFLKNYLPSKTGNIIDIDTNEIIGEHIGVLYYTIGQRKGLGIGGNGGPWFVIGKNVETNELYVCSKEDNPWLFADSCLVSGMNWFSNKEKAKQFKCSAKFRYRQKDHAVRVEILNDKEVMVYFDKPIMAITPGQEAVFYNGDICLGGGVIEHAYRNKNDIENLIKVKRNEK